MRVDNAYSKGLYSNFNLATHTGDDIKSVYKNRLLLNKLYNLLNEPKWLNQIHSNICLDASKIINLENGDASITREIGVVCAILTADCLPIFASDTKGEVVGICHAGWKGILNGVIESFIKNMGTNPNNIKIYFGVAIGENAFELGEDVYLKFINKDIDFKEAFREKNSKYFLDIYKIAIIILNKLQIKNIFYENKCTYNGEYFSYRRDGEFTGRNAHLIWIDK